MAEQSGEDKFIRCSKCKCKYINDYEHIKKDFGYTRLEEQYKTCIKCRNKSVKYEKNRAGRSTARRTQILNQETKDDHKTCSCCLKVKQLNEFTEGDRQFKYCKMCRNNNNEKKNRVLTKEVADSQKICTKCLKAKQSDEFTEDGKEYKFRSPCRNKPKQKLLELKEQLVGGPTQICSVCNIEQGLKQYIHMKRENKVARTCNTCCKQIFEDYQTERRKRIQEVDQ